MPFHDKVADFLDDVIPNEIKPYLGTAAAAYAGPAIGGMFGGGILQNFLAGAGSDILTQQLIYGSDEDRDTDYLSAGMSGILSGLQGVEKGFLGGRDPVARTVDTSVPGVQKKFQDRLDIGSSIDRTKFPTSQAYEQAVIDAGGALSGKGNYFQSDFLKGLSDFATPFDFSGVGQSATPIKDIIGETTSSLGMLQLGQTPSQVKNAADALKDAERRYQEYLDQLSADQRASVEEDRQARIAAYKQYMGLAGYSNEEIETALFQAGHIGEGETVYAARGGRIGFDVGGGTGGKTDNMGIGNYIEAEKVRTEYIDKLKRMLQAEQVKMKMNDPGLMRFGNALMPGGEGFYTRQEMAFPDMKARYEQAIEKMKMDQARDDYERDQMKKQLRKDEFDDIVNMIDDRFSDNRQQRKMASVGGRMTPEGDPISPDVPKGMQMDLRPGGFIPLGTKPKADDVPAMVGKNEFVLNDEAVSGIGKLLTGQPDPRAGARALYDLQSKMEAIV
tara:strand:- start:188 stop:1693 length:1506 start_codon:yes stop_codon:yes gene_type:complete